MLPTVASLSTSCPATWSRCTRCSWTMPCGFRASSTKPVLTTASARRYAVWCRSPIRTGTCCSISFSAVACIRSRFCRAERLWTSSATCALPSIPTRPLPTHSTPCALCCCRCSTCWAARCRLPMCTTLSRPATAACSPVWAQAFTMRRCCSPSTASIPASARKRSFAPIGWCRHLRTAGFAFSTCFRRRSTAAPSA